MLQLKENPEVTPSIVITLRWIKNTNHEIDKNEFFYRGIICLKIW